MDSSYLLPNVASSDGEIKNESSVKPGFKKSFLNWMKLVGINLLAFGLELCASAGFTYIPPIMLKSGFSDKTLTIVLGIGPCISLLLVPFIGRCSDKCQSRFGRRRPFMLLLGMIMIFSLLIIPFSVEINQYFNVSINQSVVLPIGVVLLDFSSQALMNPCKALIPDIFFSLEEQNSGFTVYSCMLSLGGCVGYFITSLNWSDTYLGFIFGDQEKAVFSLLALLFFAFLIINLIVAKEKPFEKQYVAHAANGNGVIDCLDHTLSDQTSCSEVNTFTFLPEMPKLHKYFKRTGLNNSIERINFCNCIQHVKTMFSIRTARSCCRKLLCLLFSFTAFFGYILKNFTKMPPVLFRLFLACLFGWMGFFCHDMYYSDFVGQVIYNGEPHAERQSVAVSRYDEGVRMGSWGLLFHSLSAALYAAAVQERLICYFGQRNVYLFGMFSFSCSLLGTVLTKNLILVNIFAACSGLGLAAITTVPYSLVTEYSETREIYYNNNAPRGVGEDMAVLDSAFYLSQIIPSIFLGCVVEFTKSSSTYMVMAFLCGAIAFYLTFFIKFPKSSHILK